MTNFKGFKINQNFRNTSKNTFKQSKKNFSNYTGKDKKMTNFKKIKGFSNIMKIFIILAVLLTNVNILISQPAQEWAVIKNTGNLSISSMSEDNAGNILIAGGNKLVKYNASGGQVWEITITGILNSVYTDANNNIYVTGKNENYRTSCITIKYNASGVQQWISTESGDTNNSRVGYIICPDNTGNIYVSVGRFLYNSGGVQSYTSTVKYNSNGVKMFERNENGKSTGKMIIHDQNLYVLSNSPLYWTPYTLRYYVAKYDLNNNLLWVVNDTLGAMDMAVDVNGNVYVTSYGNSYTGSMNGTSKYNSSGMRQWITLHNDTYRSIAADNNGNIYVTGENTAKFNSSGTAVWSQINNGTGNIIKLSQSGEIFVAGQRNNDFLLMNYTSNGGQNWVRTYNSPNNANDIAYNLILKNSSIMVSGTSGNNSIALVKYSSTVGVHSQGNEIPEKFSLSQNYPNPFNPSTKIAFDVPAEANVKIEVFDISGRKVDELVNENMKAGSYEVEWNALKLSSGTYFYRMQTGSFTETKKMILIK